MTQLNTMIYKIIKYVKNEFELHIGVTHHCETLKKDHSICFHKLCKDVA